MSTNEATIQIITREDDSSRSSRGPAELVSAALTVGKLRESFNAFMTNLQSIVDVKEQTVGPFRLEEIEFSAEITADGEFKLMGTGIGLEATSAVTFTLKRKNAD